MPYWVIKWVCFLFLRDIGTNCLYLWLMENTHESIQERIESIENRIDQLNHFVEQYLGPLTAKLEKLAESSEDHERNLKVIAQDIQIAKEMLSENDRDFADIYKKLATMAQVKNDLDAGRAVIVHDAEVVDDKNS